MRLKLLKLVSPLLAFFIFSPLLHLHPPSSVFLKKSGLHYSDACHSGHGQLKPPSATHSTADNGVQSSSGSGSRPVKLKERWQDTVSLLLLFGGLTDVFMAETSFEVQSFASCSQELHRVYCL